MLGSLAKHINKFHMPNSPEVQYPHLYPLLNQEGPLTEAQLADLRAGFEDGLDSANTGHSPKTAIGADVRKHLWNLRLMPTTSARNESGKKIETEPKHAQEYWTLINQFRGRVDSALATRKNIGTIPNSYGDPDAYVC